MAQRMYVAFVWTAWLASMGWLFVAKIWPTLSTGKPPDYSWSAPEEPRPVVWNISWNNRRIGSSASLVERTPEGHRVKQVVRFHRLPWEAMLSESLGLFGSLLRGERRAAEAAWEVNMLVATELRFTADQRLTGLQAVADLGDIPGFITLDGQLTPPDQLRLTTRLLGGGGESGRRWTNDLRLPPQALVSDAFTPRPELRSLELGQRWTMPIYRPFPPNAPIQIVAATAERHELILWHGEDVETILVVYRDEAGSGLGTNREPIAREWVREGQVLQSEVRWSGMTLHFERAEEPDQEPVVEWLDTNRHPRLWKRQGEP